MTADLAAVVADLAATAEAVRRGAAQDPADLLEALVLLRRAQAELAALEPELITAARAAGVSWQSLAPALGVASRQAAERRYLRSTSADPANPGATRDARVQAERDRRAGDRAVTRWANDNTADLRRLAGQVVALTDLSDAAAGPIGRLHEALGAPDAAALPGRLADAQSHLRRHPDLAAEIDAVTEQTAHLRRGPADRRRDTSG
ncbi:hypothetical protein Aab01nite_84490 [Paractinoplanes abujensis]|uniref:HSP18 transcriptional regulator n=1 Tax=Paractinoplanes abujensis TaxID=882441 RepID=A0A7W7CQZ6_9ACTN|nr:HSP18 transcriptional regulator [Actinoplanes abujensis]MBB4693072.1 hypothetical protein [Actinoplanes abujensis]GID24859.1 hypothetical protein Aab01nite_84490 [Actinoplanes abujensis]